MNWQILLPEYPSQQPEWVTEDIRLIFFKCIKWQFEETMDPINCPYHYFCDSVYPGNYSSSVDILVLIFITASYFSTLLIMVMDISRKGHDRRTSKRYLLMSGPIFLPLIILALATGFRINTIFPMSVAGPAILLLVLISALSIDYGAARDVKCVFFEASTTSGILHASLYLDAILFPYYTGLDALTSSSFSGECPSCVCRTDMLVVGRAVPSYRGWSVTTLSVVCALCFRIICCLHGKVTKKILLAKSLLEGFGVVLVAFDCMYLLASSPPERLMLCLTIFGAVLVLICVYVLRKFCCQIIRKQTKHTNSIGPICIEGKIEEL